MLFFLQSRVTWFHVIAGLGFSFSVVLGNQWAMLPVCPQDWNSVCLHNIGWILQCLAKSSPGKPADAWDLVFVPDLLKLCLKGHFKLLIMSTGSREVSWVGVGDADFVHPCSPTHFFTFPTKSYELHFELYKEVRDSVPFLTNQYWLLIRTATNKKIYHWGW